VWNSLHVLITEHTHTHAHFTAFCLGLPGWAGTRRNIHQLTPILIIGHPLSTSSIYYDPWHPLRSVYVPDSPFPLPLSRSSLVFLLVLDPLLHTLCISSPSHHLLFTAHTPWVKKDTNSCPQLPQMLTDFQNSFTNRLSGKFATNSYLNIPPHLKCVATLPCEISMFKNRHAQELIEANCHVRLSHSKNCFKILVW